MKAAVITGVGQCEVTTVPDPTPGPRDVVIEVAACGICGTDLHILQGEFAPTLPIVPGHEFAGTVVALGSAVTDVAVGDRVAADPSLYCGHCYYCKRAQGNMCENWNAIGVVEPGGAADFVRVPAGNCVKLPDSVRVEDAALIEPLSCAVHGYDVLRARVAGSVLIYGAGTMGLMMAAMAQRTGAASVDVVDVSADRLAGAAELGVSRTAASADELDAPRGWDLVIDATGNARAIQDAISRVGKCGTYLQFGVTDYSTTVTIEPYRIYRDEITITGSMAVLHSYDRAAALFADGVIDPDFFISHRLPLSQYSTALDMVARGEGRKVQVVP